MITPSGARQSHHGMHPVTPHSHGDSRGQVSITDKPDACSLSADFFDQSTLARSVEHDNRQVLHVAI